MSTHTPKCNCPVCGYRLNAATHTGEEPATPSPGDLSVCINCGAGLRFKEDLTLRELTPEDYKEMTDEEFKDFMHAQHAVIQLSARRPSIESCR